MLNNDTITILTFAVALLAIIIGVVFNRSFRDSIVASGDGDEFTLFGVLSAKGAIFVVVLAILSAALHFTYKEANTHESERNDDALRLQTDSQIREFELNVNRLKSENHELKAQNLSLTQSIDSCSTPGADMETIKTEFQNCQSTLMNSQSELVEWKTKAQTNNKIVFVDIMSKAADKPVGDTGYSVWVSDVSGWRNKVDVRFKKTGSNPEVAKILDKQVGQTGGVIIEGNNYEVLILGANPVDNTASLLIRKL